MCTSMFTLFGPNLLCAQAMHNMCLEYSFPITATSNLKLRSYNIGKVAASFFLFIHGLFYKYVLFYSWLVYIFYINGLFYTAVFCVFFMAVLQYSFIHSCSTILFNFSPGCYTVFLLMACSPAFLYFIIIIIIFYSWRCKGLTFSQSFPRSTLLVASWDRSRDLRITSKVSWPLAQRGVLFLISATGICRNITPPNPFTRWQGFPPTVL